MVAGAALNLKGLGDVHTAPDAPRNDEGVPLTDPRGQVRVAVRPMSTFLGTFVRDTNHQAEHRLAGDWLTTSPRPGESRVVRVELTAQQEARWIHLVLRRLPNLTLVEGATLKLIRADGRAVVDAEYPTELVSDSAGRVALIWPAELTLWVRAPDCVESDYRWPKGPLRALVETHPNEAQALAAEPVTLDVARCAAVRGDFDPARKMTGEVHSMPLRNSMPLQLRRTETGRLVGDGDRKVSLDQHGRWRIDGLIARLPEDASRIYTGTARGSCTLELDLKSAAEGSSHQFTYRVTLEAGEERLWTDPFRSLVHHDVDVWLDGERAPEGLTLELRSITAKMAEGQPFEEGAILFMLQVEEPSDATETLKSYNTRRVVDARGHVQFEGPAGSRFLVFAHRPGKQLAAMNLFERNYDAVADWSDTTAGSISLVSKR